jgi:hypothetical protein
MTTLILLFTFWSDPQPFQVSQPDEAELRYRGIEALLAKFEAEAEATQNR